MWRGERAAGHVSLQAAVGSEYGVRVFASVGPVRQPADGSGDLVATGESAVWTLRDIDGTVQTFGSDLSTAVGILAGRRGPAPAIAVTPSQDTYQRDGNSAAAVTSGAVGGATEMGGEAAGRLRLRLGRLGRFDV